MLIDPTRSTQMLAYCADDPSSASSSKTPRAAGTRSSAPSEVESGSTRSATSARTSSRPAAAATRSRRHGRPRHAHDHRGRARRHPALDGRPRAPCRGRAKTVPASPVYAIERARRERKRPVCGPPRVDDLPLLVPACAATHLEELGIDPLKPRRRRVPQANGRADRRGRSWLWEEDGTILFKAEASAWTPSAVQLQQVWVDPAARRQGHATRGLSRPLPAASRAHADASASSSGPRTRPRSASTTRRHAPRRRLPQRALLGTMSA